MAKLTIDRQHVDLADGATVLDGARQLGIDIPTLCHVPGLAPLVTCFVCVVEMVGAKKLLPACATVAADGMVVVTDSPQVLAARKTAIELLLSDHLGECEAPCQISCPAGLRVPTFMEELIAGRPDSAAAIAADDLVLPAVLGRICPRFCEHSCRRQERDQPVAIGDLHRQAAERSLAGKSAAPAISNHKPAPSSGKRVAIVGAGPTGLAAAYCLTRKGHGCVVMDARPAPGGMIRYSVDETRLPKAVLAGEIAAILRLGVEFRPNVLLGRDVTVGQLRSEFDAVLLAVGAGNWHKLSCPGSELAEPADEVLAKVSAGEAVDLDGDVIVLGAGQEMIQVALTAARHGASSVTVLCARPPQHLPLLGRQLKLAESAGVRFVFATQIESIRRPALRLYVTAIGANKEPVKVDGNRVLVALGRETDLTMLSGQGIEIGPRGAVVNRATLATNVPGVFAGGDMIGGGGFAVRAVAHGKQAAESIDQFLRGLPVTGPARPHTVRYGKLADAEKALLQSRAANSGPRLAEIGDEKSARSEAARCLICGCQDNDRCRLRQEAGALAADFSRFRGERRAMERDASHPLIVYESHKCIMCGACVAIAKSAGAAGELGELTYVGRGFNVRVAAPWGGKLADALGDDADLARRLAESCPTSAIVLKRK